MLRCSKKEYNVIKHYIEEVIYDEEKSEGHMCCIIGGVIWSSLSFPSLAAEQVNLATAESRPYNGTAIVDVTDMYFQEAVSEEDYADMSATAKGVLASPDAGHYTILTEMTDFAFYNRDPDSDVDFNDWYVVPERMENIATDVTISKIDSELRISASEQSAEGGSEITVSAVIVNDFGYEAGLPKAEEIEFTAVNAKMKEGTAVTRTGNKYSAVFVLSDDAQAEEADVTVNVLPSAVNYNALAEGVSANIQITHKQAPARPDDTYQTDDTQKAEHTEVLKGAEKERVSEVPKTGDWKNSIVWYIFAFLISGTACVCLVKRKGK